MYQNNFTNNKNQKAKFYKIKNKNIYDECLKKLLIRKAYEEAFKK